MKLFYPIVKKHISPSAFASWFGSRASFIKAYFLGEKGTDTASMRAGKRIHQLIEGGFLKVKHRYSHAEKPLCFALMPGIVGSSLGDVPYIEQLEVDEDDYSYVLPEGSIGAMFGIPDSFELPVGTFEARFVDYKSGRENTWDAVKLAGDLKMKMTALLVWLATGRPLRVVGYIEYVPTKWNEETREVEPTDGESEVAAEITYTSEEMEAMLPVIVKTMNDINKAYDEYEESTDEFVNQDDVATYAELEQERRRIDAQQAVIKERIGEQMTMGKKDTLTTPFGSFFFTTKKKFAYPHNLKINYLNMGIVLEDADAIAAAAAAAKAKFETENEPESVSKVFSFRGKK